MNRGEKIYNWITEHLDAGRTVYATTYLKSIKITPKYRTSIRYHNGHCEVQRGKHWDSINYCEITAN